MNKGRRDGRLTGRNRCKEAERWRKRQRERKSKDLRKRNRVRFVFPLYLAESRAKKTVSQFASGLGSMRNKPGVKKKNVYEIEARNYFSFPSRSNAERRGVH